MTPPDSLPRTADDLRLLNALEDLHAAREAGRPLSRASFLARHPDIASELGAVFDTLEQARQGTTDELAPTTFDNYHLLGEIARGGMGVIYQALQLDVGRLVALKVLAGPGSPRARERFRQEAAVAARLHHTNIVPVFGMARGDGVAAYAMPFIDGPSLAETLADLRTKAPRHPVSEGLLALHSRNRQAYFRRIAELGMQAAEALEHAHRNGVLHRDVKPGNLLVEQSGDGRLHLWLHDFGLARIEGMEDLARPGEPFGTPGYQSPEQAAGDTAAIDARSDVYSLGVALFELLTLERPRDHGDLLRLERAFPLDLRLIVARCLAPRSEERYASALALAEDLRRFLLDYPVQARRTTWRLHLVKWAKRHRRPLVAALAAFVITAVAGAGFLVRAYRAEQAARREAERREELAARGVATFSPVVDDVMHATAGVREKHRELLETAYAIDEELLAARPDDLLRQRRLASVSWRLGRVNHGLRRFEEAETAYRRSLELYEGLVRAEPDDPIHRLDVIRSWALLSPVLTALGRKDEAEAANVRALGIARETAARFPDKVFCQDALACYCCDRGRFLLKAGKPAEAEELFREGLAAARAAVTEDFHSRNQVFANQLSLAVALDQQGKPDEALKAGEEALESVSYLIDQASRANGPDRKLDLLTYNQDRANLELDQARRLIRAERWGEAEAVLEKSRAATTAYLPERRDLATSWLEACEALTKELAERKPRQGAKP